MSNSDTRGLLAGLGIGAALILCCAGPVLIAAGALGALAGIFSSPWLWAAAGVALVSAGAHRGPQAISHPQPPGRLLVAVAA